MSEWISIEQWPECARLERPGIAFELRNMDGQSLLSACSSVVPETPFDWTSPPIQYRIVVEAPARHSAPIPAPAGHRR